jgi:hypothetical protein
MHTIVITNMLLFIIAVSLVYQSVRVSEKSN